MKITLIVDEGDSHREFDLTDKPDALCFVKASVRKQRTFTLVEQDVTAAATILFWASLQQNESIQVKARADATAFANSWTHKKWAD